VATENEPTFDIHNMSVICRGRLAYGGWRRGLPEIVCGIKASCRRQTSDEMIYQERIRNVIASLDQIIRFLETERRVYRNQFDEIDADFQLVSHVREILLFHLRKRMN